VKICPKLAYNVKSLKF